MGAVKAILLALALFITGVCGWTLLTLPCLPLLFINVSYYRYMNDCSLQLWYKVVPVSHMVTYNVSVSCISIVGCHG